MGFENGRRGEEGGRGDRRREGRRGGRRGRRRGGGRRGERGRKRMGDNDSDRKTEKRGCFMIFRIRPNNFSEMESGGEGFWVNHDEEGSERVGKKEGRGDGNKIVEGGEEDFFFILFFFFFFLERRGVSRERGEGEGEKEKNGGGRDKGKEMKPLLWWNWGCLLGKRQKQKVEFFELEKHHVFLLNRFHLSFLNGEKKEGERNKKRR